MRPLAAALDVLCVRLELRLERLLLPAPAYTAMRLEHAIAGLGSAVGRSFVPLLEEPELREIEGAVRQAAAAIPEEASLPRVHHASLRLARLCYALARATQPEVVVETGVAYGVTSAFLLRALECNGRGELHSIDRAPALPGADRWVGLFVPEALRGRWTLHRGASLEILPRILPGLSPVGLFLHDSRHTYRNVLGELRQVERHLAPGAVVLADDIERNVAFERWLAGRRARFKGVVAEGDKEGLLGICVL